MTSTSSKANRASSVQSDERVAIGQTTADETPEASDLEQSEVGGLLSPRCTLPPITGPCRARKLRWFFDMETGTCTTFVYGGCRGNGNRFPSREKCLSSCLGEQDPRFRAEVGVMQAAAVHKPTIPVRPTQSPTKKITFMMPLLSFFNKRVSSGPTASPLRKSPMTERSNPLRNPGPPSSAFVDREAMTVIRHASLGMRSRHESMRPEGEAVSEDFRQSFSPLRYMIMRAMFKPASRNLRSGGSQPPQAKPTIARVRVLLPRLQVGTVPSFQKQQPMPKLAPIRAAMDRARMPPNRGFSQFQRGDNFEESLERAAGHGIFAPKMVRKSEFESLSHDNKHFNNVSPNNRFTLLQVFVNKHNGRQYFDDPSRRTRQSAPSMGKLPALRSSEPFNQAAKSFKPDYHPMMYPMKSPYSPYPTAFWDAHMPPHYHNYPAPHSYHNQFPRGPMPFSPRNSFGASYKPQLPAAPPMPRRPVAVRPVLVTSQRNDNEEDQEKSRLSCLLPLAPGRCKSYQTKWYYNRVSGKCEIFYYTGCGGNANKFETWEECAATCLESHPEPKSTVPSHVMERPNQDEAEATEDKDQDTIIITSTRFPENEAEEKQAMKEAQTESAFVEHQLSSTTEKPEPEIKEEEDSKQEENEVLKERQVVISEATALSTHYIMLLAVITIVALAIVVLVSISSVHLCRKMRANKKERILETVLKQQLGADVPNLVYTVKPSPEQTGKSEA